VNIRAFLLLWFNDGLNTSENTVSNERMINALMDNTWNNAAAAYFEVMCWNLPEGIEKNHKNSSVWTACVMAKLLGWGHRNVLMPRKTPL
jgi:hypothetical protein